MIGTILFLRLLLLAILALIFYRLIARIWRRISPGKSPRDRKDGKEVEEMKRDPICGIYVPQSQAFTYQHEGKSLYFCSKNCLEAHRRLEKKGCE